MNINLILVVVVVVKRLKLAFKINHYIYLHIIKCQTVMKYL